MSDTPDSDHPADDHPRDDHPGDDRQFSASPSPERSAGARAGDPDSLDRAVAGAAMRLAAEKGWRGVGLLEVARAAALPLSVFRRRFRGRADLLAAVCRVVDATVLATEVSADPEESARDRLFDVMMRRFDALLPFRDGLRMVVRDLPGEPVTALAFSCTVARSMGWMLRAAGIEPEQRGGGALVAGLGATHAHVMRVFLEDDSADLSRTMAALDSDLRRAERWAATFCRWNRKSPQPGEPSAASSG